MAEAEIIERERLEGEILRFIQAGEGDFGSLLLEAARWQRTANPAYRAYCSTFPEPRHWREIPALPLSAFREAEIFCFPPEEAVVTFRTSGTTGEGYGRHHFKALELYRAAALEGWRQAGLPEGNAYGLVPSPQEAPHSSLSRMAGWLVREDRFFFGHWEDLLNLLRFETAPCLLFGTALAFLDLFEHSEALTLPPGSLALETGGYKGTGRALPKEELYGLFAEKLGLGSEAVWNEYGMTELSSQFYTRGLGGAHAGAPWVRALVIDPRTGTEAKDGETGLLHIFDLANLDSCCAVQTRDLAVRTGDDFILLGRDPQALPRGCSRAADSLLAP